MGITWKNGEIERRREALKLSRAEAAKRAGFSTAQQWTTIEGGLRRLRPSAETMLRVARALRCKVEDLIHLD